MIDTSVWLRFQRDFMGLDARVPLAPGSATTDARRVYLDAAATCLMPRAVWGAQGAYLSAACANPHTTAHLAGRASTQAVEDARAAVGRLMSADPVRDAVVFVGHNATAALNLACAIVAKRVGPNDLVYVSKQEHHSNLLPWLNALGRARVRPAPVTPDGSLDFPRLVDALRRDAGRVKAVVLTAASNVTGTINAVHAVARAAHAAGALVVVDAAQAAPHMPLPLHLPNDPAASLDFVALAGHKLYCPGSPGVLIGRRDLFPEGPIGPTGGGTVVSVDFERVVYERGVEARAEAGTPNVVGCVGLGVAAGILAGLGMDVVRAHEVPLIDAALARLGAVAGVELFGARDTAARPRVGIVAFNVAGLPHGVAAAALHDSFGLAVRNACFCAQPLVRDLLGNDRACVDGICDAAGRPGMVRASFGAWTTPADIDVLVEGVRWVASRASALRRAYVRRGERWALNGWEPPTCFDLGAVTAAALRP